VNLCRIETALFRRSTPLETPLAEITGFMAGARDASARGMMNGRSVWVLLAVAGCGGSKSSDAVPDAADPASIDFTCSDRPAGCPTDRSRVCVQANTLAGLDDAGGTVTGKPMGIQDGNEGAIAANGANTMVFFRDRNGHELWSVSSTPTVGGSWQLHSVDREWDLSQLESPGNLAWLTASPCTSSPSNCKVRSDPKIAGVPRTYDDPTTKNLVATPDGFVFTAMLFRPGYPWPGTASDVLLGFTPDAGKHFTFWVVNDDTSANPGGSEHVDRPQLAVGPTGAIAVSWRNGGNHWFRELQFYANGKPVFSPVTPVAFRNLTTPAINTITAPDLAEGLQELVPTRYLAFTDPVPLPADDDGTCNGDPNHPSPTVQQSYWFAWSSGTAAWAFQPITTDPAFPYCVGPDYGRSVSPNSGLGNGSAVSLAVDPISHAVYVALVTSYRPAGQSSATTAVHVMMSRNNTSWTSVGDMQTIDQGFEGQPASGWQYLPQLALLPGSPTTASQLALDWRATDANGDVVVRATIGDCAGDGSVKWRTPQTLSSTAVPCSPSCAAVPFGATAFFGDYNGCTALRSMNAFACLFADERLDPCGSTVTMPWVGTFSAVPGAF
jgi:hypothetical protein